MTAIEIPQLALVVLVGISGSGKSTFASRHFRPTQVLSSDSFRGMVADDENDQSATGAAFDALYHVAGLRLRGGRLTVVDATNVQPHARAGLVRLAREHDVLPVAVVLDVPVGVCWERTRDRPDRQFGRQVLARQHRELHQSLNKLRREGFRHVTVLAGEPEVAAAEVTFTRLYNDRRDATGPFDVIGDVHGCRAELEQLLGDLGWELVRDSAGRPVNAVHPAGRTAVFVGDLVDRGPDSPGVLRLVMGMVAAGTALCVAGNHEQKLLNYLRGRRVKVAHGLAETLAQLETEPAEFRAGVAPFLDSLVSHYVLSGGELVVAHAGLKEEYHGRASGRVRSFALYGDTTGETDEYGLPVRYPWARDYRGAATVVYGHTPTTHAEWVNNTICVDTGCVFGGGLTALRWPERELVTVPAQREHYPPVRPLGPGAAGGVAPGPSAGGTTQDQEPDLLRLADVTGRLRIPTGHGPVPVAPENAAAALEVMSRFALAPSTLVWLPPTMAPCSTASTDGYLEHPEQAFADYRAAGVDTVMCQEKHMGSRAVVLVCRDRAAGAGFGVATGAIWTRTGRPFFADPARTGALLDRVRAAVTAAGLWDELATGWLLFDTEVLPWSAKAEQLIREQYATVGAAARAALPPALAVLAAAGERGIDTGGLPDRLAARQANAAAFTAAYQSFLGGPVRLAPFAVLAGAGVSYTGRDHGWQLAAADRLVAADPELFTATRRRVVELSDPAAVAAATQWWLELTEAGGEGMVVKPYQGLAAARDGRLHQPGLKCRGREYLRLSYGPDYLEPAALARLRGRSLGRKRRLALREHALGLAALEGLASGVPLWRRHQQVFAILACESEPVDPRL